MHSQIRIYIFIYRAWSHGGKYVNNTTTQLVIRHFFTVIPNAINKHIRMVVHPSTNHIHCTLILTLPGYNHKIFVCLILRMGISSVSKGRKRCFNPSQKPWRRIGANNSAPTPQQSSSLVPRVAIACSRCFAANGSLLWTDVMMSIATPQSSFVLVPRAPPAFPSELLLLRWNSLHLCTITKTILIHLPIVM